MDVTCPFCGLCHPDYNCYVVRDPRRRFEIVTASRRCYRCYGHDHCAYNSPSGRLCELCRGLHAEALCRLNVGLVSAEFLNHNESLMRQALQRLETLSVFEGVVLDETKMHNQETVDSMDEDLINEQLDNEMVNEPQDTMTMINTLSQEVELNCPMEDNMNETDGSESSDDLTSLTSDDSSSTLSSTDPSETDDDSLATEEVNIESTDEDEDDSPFYIVL